MTDKYLINNLKKLKTLSPDKTWQKNAKSLFMSQITNSGARELSSSDNFKILIKSLFSLSFKPVAVTLTSFMLLLTTSIFAHQAFEGNKPDDSLYIARIVSERAKLNTVLDSKARERLATKFAASHAKEISLILADPDFDLKANQEKIAKLNDSFNKEIDSVRTNVTNWDSQKDLIASSSEDLKNDDELLVSIADSNKDEEGIEVSLNNNETSTADRPLLEEIEKIEEDLEDPALIDLVNQAKDLYDEGLEKSDKDKLQEAGAKLEQVKELINN